MLVDGGELIEPSWGEVGRSGVCLRKGGGTVEPFRGGLVVPSWVEGGRLGVVPEKEGAQLEELPTSPLGLNPSQAVLGYELGEAAGRLSGGSAWGQSGRGALSPMQPVRCQSGPWPYKAGERLEARPVARSLRPGGPIRKA